jgi:transcriptional regulator with XRE-family HTH domain
MHTNQLRLLRKRAGITQRVVAAALGVSEAQVSRWESGHDNVPSSRLHAMETAYRATVGEMFGGEAPAAEPKPVAATTLSLAPVAINAENLAPLLAALLPLVPRGRLTDQSLTALSEALAYGLQLLGDPLSSPAGDGALAVAARGVVARFRELGSA